MNLKRSPSARPAAILGLMKAGRSLNAPQPEAPQRVRVVPSPDGVVVIVGVTQTGEWVAEHRCLADDFNDRMIQAMERTVRRKEQETLRLVR